MKIKNIKINSYGNLKNKEINFENNLNIIYGKNESGKSTLLNYIKNIFYGISKNKNGKEISDYEKYTPWTGEEFSGKIKYELDDGKTFEVYRDFNKKNSKVFNENLEDISDQFKIVKKEGNQFFYEQTGVDENTYLSTIMSPQQELILDTQSQNALLQKIANLAGTGDDKVSFQKAIERLNKKQVEEVGTSRTQDRPLNVLKKRMKEIEFVLKGEFLTNDDKQNLHTRKEELEKNLLDEKNKNNAIRQLNMLTQKNQINLEKNKLKIKIKNENEEKIKKLNQEKNNLLKNNLNNLEKNKKIINNNLQKNKLNKKIKINYFIFLIFFILLIILNIFNFIFIKNKIINYILFSFIPIELILFFIYYLKNKKIKNKLNKELLEKEFEEKINNQKIQEKINLINEQINLLENEVEKQKNEILETEKEIDEKRDESIKNIQKENPNMDFSKILDLQEPEEIQKELEKSNEMISAYGIKLNGLEYEEKEISNKLEEIISLKEEYENLKEQLEIIEEKNKYINITKELLEKAYEKMKNSVTPIFTKNLSELIEKISGGKYKKITIHEQKGIIVELENGEYVSANLLSTGTIDELYLSLRLAMLDEISKEKMPIILDEPFAYFDDERLENSLLFLNEKSSEHQIILFTCTGREKQILDKLNIKYNLIKIN